jgi:hypothetical protein
MNFHAQARSDAPPRQPSLILFSLDGILPRHVLVPAVLACVFTCLVATGSDSRSSADFGLRSRRSSSPYLALYHFAIIVYLVVAQLRAIGFFRRGELTYWQIWVLSTPMALVAVTCILLRAFVLAFFGHGHATI